MFGISAFAQAPFAALGENVVIVALTGVSASGAVGSVEPAKSFALTGVSATGDVGTVVRGDTSLALSGVEAS